MIVKLPCSIHSAGVFLTVYFWCKAILGARESMWGRGKGIGPMCQVRGWGAGAGDGQVSVWSVGDEKKLCSVGGSLISL